MIDPMLTPQKVADVLGVSRNTVYGLVKAGAFPHYTQAGSHRTSGHGQNRHIKIPESDVAAFVTTQRAETERRNRAAA